MTDAPAAGHIGRPNTTLSWIAVVLVPFLFALWFWMAMVLIGDPNEPTAPHGWNGVWRVVVLWIAVEIVPALGILFGARAVRHGEHGGRAALIANVLIFVGLTLTTLVGGLSDALD